MTEYVREVEKCRPAGFCTRSVCFTFFPPNLKRMQSASFNEQIQWSYGALAKVTGWKKQIARSEQC